MHASENTRGYICTLQICTCTVKITVYWYTGTGDIISMLFDIVCSFTEGSFLFSVSDTTEHNQLGLILGSSGGGVVLIAFLLKFFAVCATMNEWMKKIIVAAIAAGKSPAEVKDYADILKGNINKQQRKKQQCKRHVVTNKADFESVF